jgi:hypothetical protein
MCQQVSLEVFAQVSPQEIVCEQLSQHEAWGERERVLNMFLVIHLLLASALWTRLALPRVLERLARPLHVLGLPLSAMQVTGPAITSSSQAIGPGTSPGTLCPLLSSPLHTGMFILHEAQFTGLGLWHAIRQRQAHVMGPVPSHHLSSYLRQLSDGSYLAVYTPTKQQERSGIKPLLVRVMEYRITDERLGELGKTYRLATTWLNPRTAPALSLIDCYHERWEVEVVLDEIKTHQHLQQPVLRSRTPDGVRQEVYALLLAHYAVRALMHQAACQAEVDPDRLRFTDALFVLSETTRDLAQVEPAFREPLIEEMSLRLTARLLPPRRLRANPRVLKKLYRKYKRKPQDQPLVPPFDPQDQFLDFVILLI